MFIRRVEWFLQTVDPDDRLKWVCTLAYVSVWVIVLVALSAVRLIADASDRLSVCPRD